MWPPSLPSEAEDSRGTLSPMGVSRRIGAPTQGALGVAAIAGYPPVQLGLGGRHAIRAAAQATARWKAGEVGRAAQKRTPICGMGNVNQRHVCFSNKLPCHQQALIVCNRVG